MRVVSRQQSNNILSHQKNILLAFRVAMIKWAHTNSCQKDLPKIMLDDDKMMIRTRRERMVNIFWVGFKV